MKKQVLILNYHQIDDGKPSEMTGIEKVFAVKRSAFEEHIRILVKHKIPVVSCADLISGHLPDGLSVALTVDDGNASDFGIVYPILKGNGMTATFFLLSGKREFPFGKQLQKMTESGFTVGSHGITHRGLVQLKPDEIRQELEISRKILEEETGRPVEFFAFPFGIYIRKIIRQAEAAGYKAVFTTDAALNQVGNSRQFVFHRWSVKRSISLKQFEAIVTGKFYLKKFILLAKIKKSARSLLGHRLSDRMNILLNQILTRQVD